MWWNSRTWISLSLFISKILSRLLYSVVLIHDHTADQGQPRQKTILRFEPRHELYSRERHCPSRSKRRERTAAVGRIGKRTLACFTRVAFTCFFSTKQGKPDKAMLTDFGFARKISGDERSTTFCGSFAYVPPEVLSNEPYRPMLADCWSMGGLRGWTNT